MLTYWDLLQPISLTRTSSITIHSVDFHNLFICINLWLIGSAISFHRNSNILLAHAGIMRFLWFIWILLVQHFCCMHEMFFFLFFSDEFRIPLAVCCGRKYTPVPWTFFNVKHLMDFLTHLCLALKFTYASIHTLTKPSTWNNTAADAIETKLASVSDPRYRATHVSLERRESS